MEAKKLLERAWRREAIEKFNKWSRCADCNHLGDYYMLNNTVWEEAFPDYIEVKKKRRLEDPSASVQLCLRCVEIRLDRFLTIDDFTTAPVNDSIFFGYRIGKAARSEE